MIVKKNPAAILHLIDQETEALALEPWKTPTPLDAYERKAFPVEAFDIFGTIGPFVRELAKFSQTPIDLPACTVLGTLSAAAMGKFEVEVEAGYVEPVCLYILNLLQSGSRKSAVFRAANSPILAWEREQNSAERQELAAWESRQRINQKKLSNMEIALSKPAKESPYGSITDIELEVEALARELEVTKPPRVTQVIADDITSERIASKLAEQDGSLAIMSPEGGFFGNIGERYTKIPGLDNLLKGHSCDPIRTDRQGRPGETVPRPVMTVCISAQPEIAVDLGKVPGFRGKGAAARFLVSMPKSNLGRRESRPGPMNDTVVAAWRDLVTRILDIPIQGRDPFDGYPIPYRLTLDDDARELHIQFREDIETDLGEAGWLSDMTDWGSKLAGAAVRIASILHIASRRDPQNFPISVTTMQAGISIAEYFTDHAFAFFDAMAGDDGSESSATRIILQELQEMADAGMNPITRRDLNQKLKDRSRFKDSSTLDAPLAKLEDHGYIQIIQPLIPGKPGRRSYVILLNPEL